MSDMKHTKEPYKIERNHNGKVIGISGQGMKHDLDFVTVIYPSNSLQDVEANAQRIVDCVNAMAGIEDVEGFMEVIKKFFESGLQMQNDDRISGGVLYEIQRILALFPNQSESESE